MIRIASTALGSLLIAVGLAGLAGVAFGQVQAWRDQDVEAAASALEVVALPRQAVAPAMVAPAVEMPEPARSVPTLSERADPHREPGVVPASAPEPVAPTPALSGPSVPADRDERATRGMGSAPPTATLISAPSAPFLPVTRVVAPTISLAAEVVPARLVNQGGGMTWSVPAHKAGHAEATAGAGELGNVVLLGHVSSRQAGNVFGRLDDARVGDRVLVFSGERQFDYEVVEVRTVGRTDVSVVQPGDTPSVTLLTCTGLWLPMIRDYAQRLVVRAELSGARSAVTPAPATEATAAATVPRPTFEARFSDDRQAWPNDPRSTAWLAGDTYRLFARHPGQFVAVGAPIEAPLGDVVVGGTFRKVGGPPGGGYGLIVGDQGPDPRDGIEQRGRYLVFEAGDRGELGVWRREDDRWIDVIPWTRSRAVRPGGAVNDLEVRAIGGRLAFLVNGIEVVRDLEAGLPTGGGVGIFAGGDLNDVAVDRFVVAASD